MRNDRVDTASFAVLLPQRSHAMRPSQWISSIALVAAFALSGCKGDGSGSAVVAGLTIPAGASIDVKVNDAISSKEAHVGDSWTGSVVNGPNGVPTGSVVRGTVTGAKPAKKGDRAMLDLGITSITVGDHQYAVHGGTEPIIAGSPRARNLGAIAGATAGGALIGKAVSGSNKGALIGGVVGGGIATGVVAASDGYQVLLKPGTELTFTTSEAVAVKS
jgi:hypothetical protein